MILVRHDSSSACTSWLDQDYGLVLRPQYFRTFTILFLSWLMLIYPCPCPKHCPLDELPPKLQIEIGCCISFYIVPDILSSDLIRCFIFADENQCFSIVLPSVIYWMYCCLQVWTLLVLPHILLWLEKLVLCDHRNFYHCNWVTVMLFQQKPCQIPDRISHGSSLLLKLHSYFKVITGLSVASLPNVFPLCSQRVFRKDPFPCQCHLMQLPFQHY